MDKMYEDFLKIILRGFTKSQTRNPAKKLSDKVKRFVEWFIFKEHKGIFYWHTIAGENGFTLNANTNATLSELYNYWKLNIDKK